MEQNSAPLATGGDEDSLESPSTAPDQPAATPAGGEPSGPAPKPKSKTPLWRRLISRVNIYLLLFIMLLVLAGIILIVAYVAGRGGGSDGISSKDLSQSTLDELASSGGSIGSSNQVLTVRSNAIFAGKVLLRQDLEVAGNLQLGGTLALNGLSVSGTAQFGQAQVNRNLAVAGDTSLQGTATIAKSLQVNGGGTFGGAVSAPQITTSALQLNGDLTLTRHITTGGSSPSRTNGGALGSGGTSSVSGTDTAGSIAINTGGGPAAGCFITVNFSRAYGSTPQVLLTPVGSAAGSLDYYVNRSANGFSVCVASPPPAGSSFGFDYFVID